MDTRNFPAGEMPQEKQLYRTLIRKRSAHIPLQYLTGSQEFMGFSFAVFIGNYTVFRHATKYNGKGLYQNPKNYLCLDDYNGNGV